MSIFLINITPIVEAELIKKAFPEVKKDAMLRPVGPVDLLLSMTERNLHSQGGRAVGKMRLSKTALGCGQVITGVLPGQVGKGAREEMSGECRSFQGAVASLPPQGQSFFLGGLGKTTEKVLGVRELEARAPPLCQACRGCRDCKFRRERCTDDQREVLQQMEAEMVLEDGKLTASYPWKPAVQKMRNNRHQVLKIQER